METTTRAAACAPAPNHQFPSPTCRGCRLKTHAPAQLGKRRHQCATPRAVCARAPTPASPLVLSLLAISFLPEADGRRGTWECGWNCASCTAPPHVTGRSLARQPPPLPSRPAKRQLHPGRQRQTATPPERGVFGPGRTRKRRELRGQAGGKGRGQCVAPPTGPRPAPAGRGERRAVMPLPGI
jgi:hypothetical protein